jgi:5-formyltetrahydrofolate cyclo-ligase
MESVDQAKIIQDIREKNRFQRKALPSDQVQKMSQQAIEAFTRTAEGFFQSIGSWNVALYRGMPGEPQLLGLEQWCLERGMVVHYPRVVRKDQSSQDSGSPGQSKSRLRELEWVNVSVSQSSPSDWTVGAFGIQEPAPHLRAGSLEHLDWIFTPGVAFGCSGERVGMGAGFYDRLLARAQKALRIALSFECHVFPHLPQQPWDLPIHWLFTDRERFRSPQVSDWASQNGGL